MIKKYLVILFILFLVIIYFIYKNQEALKTTMLIRKHTSQLNKLMTNVEKFEEKIKNIEQKAMELHKQ